VGWSRTTDATEEPVTLTETKTFLKVDVSDDDALITRLIESARNYCEDYTGRQLVTATYSLVLDAFPLGEGAIRPPRPPLQTTGLVITYTDSNGTTQTMSDTLYDVDVKTEPGRIYPAYGEDWPTTQVHRDVVTVTYQAGYGAASAVPDEFKQAILMMVWDTYQNRGAVRDSKLVANETVKSLLAIHRLIEV